MSKVLYIDFENVQSINLSRIAQLDFKILLFTGTSQHRIPIELVKSTQAFGTNLDWVPIGGNGPNALDFHIAYYLGLHVAENPKNEYFILSKDKGFDPLINHISKSKIRCRRISSISDIENSPRAPARMKKATDTDDVYVKVVKNLTNMQENRRPRNRKTLRQHVRSLVDKSKPEEKIDQIIERLFTEKVILNGNNGLTYKL